MVSLGVGLPMPGHWPSEPAPPGVGIRHGYGCACVAAGLGRLPVAKVHTAICSLTDEQYVQMLTEANESFISAKYAGFGDDAVAAYTALAHRAEEIESFTLAFGVDADMSNVHYRRGELHLARASAQRVIDAMPSFYATAAHYLQYGEVRPIEASRDIAERIIINIDIEELRLDDAGALIERQHQRNIQRRETEAAHPGQFTPSLLISFDLDDIELDVLRARLAVARGDQAAAARHLDAAITAATDWAPPASTPLSDADRDGLLAQAATILEMARAERTRLQLNTGQVEPGHAGLVAGRLRGAGGVGADAQLAELADEMPIETLRALLAEQTERGGAAEAAETAFTLGCALLEQGDADAGLEAIAVAERGWRATGQLDAQGPRLALPRALGLTATGRYPEALTLIREAAERYAAAGAGFDAVRADVVTGMIAASAGDAGQADVALLAAVGSENLRYTLATAPEREAWDASAVQPALALALTLLGAAGRQPEVAALLERRAAVGLLDTSGQDPGEPPVPVDVGTDTMALAAGAAPLTAAPPTTWRLTPPPEEPLLAAAAESAARRYGLPRVQSPPPAPPRRPSTRTTITVRYVEVGGSVLRVWRSSDVPAEPHVSQVHPATLPGLLHHLAHTLPTPMPGEDQSAALTRARSGALAHPEVEAELALHLGLAMLGGDLAGALLTAPDRPLLLVQPSAALETVPWSLLGVAIGELPDGVRIPRAVEVADVALLAPEGVVAAAAAVAPGDGTLRVLEPTGTGLGRLLLGEAAPSHPYTREDLRADLGDRPGSFIYLGHVSAPGVLPGLQLSDGTLTALDLATMPMPPRVALLGCASAQDVGRADAASLPRAAIGAGAEIVIATPWTLPTATGLGSPAGSDPLADLAAAVENALHERDPVAACSRLTREAMHRWRHEGGPPPLLWAGVIPLVR